jgi:hypothetical protein
MIINKFKKILNKSLLPLFKNYSITFIFLNFIVWKLNSIFFKIQFFYVFIGTILLTFLFKDFFFDLANQVKNTYLFNFLLYYDLNLKNYIYKLFFNYNDKVSNFKYKKLDKFFTSYTVVFISLTLIFKLSFYIYYQDNVVLDTLVLLIFTLISFLNLIEKQFIFNIKHNNNFQKEGDILTKNFDFKFIQNRLNIKTTSFDKNSPFPYIQRRYMQNTGKELLKKASKDFSLGAVIGGLGASIYGAFEIKQKQDEINIKERKQTLNERNLALNERKQALNERKQALNERNSHQEKLDNIHQKIQRLKDDEINSSTLFYKKKNTNQIKGLEDEWDNLAKKSNMNINHQNNVSSHIDQKDMIIKKTNYVEKSSIGVEDFFI